ncbi:MAG TPA: HIT family protein [Candidatus Saccharimonadia bacterium]|nr:HIT family protein [Candidatus Saccharimonadia bacterium]
MPDQRDCQVCDVIQDDPRRLLTTEHWLISLAVDQGYLGRAWVTLRQHKGDLAELAPVEWTELHEVIRRYEAAVRAAFGAQLFNWSCLMNDAFKATHPAPHVHWHVRPRYDRPVQVEGVEFADPNFAHHYDRQYIRPVDEAMQQAIMRQIKTHL